MATRFTAANMGTIGLCFGLLLLVGLGELPTGAAQNLPLPICVIQGNGRVTSYTGQQVEIEGIVHLDLDLTQRKGFFLQDEACDSDLLTSDGIFVYLGDMADRVSPGDRVRVSGTVGEYYGLTEIISTPAQVEILGYGHALPEAIAFDPPSERTNGEQYLESLEGMRLRLDEARVVGPTDANDRTWVEGDGAGSERLFLDDPTGLALCVDDGGPAEIRPEAQAGDRLQGLIGALDFSYGMFCLQLTVEPELTHAEPAPLSVPINGLRIATFNLKNLFDTQDDPLTADTVLSEEEYERRLRKRSLAIQDVLHAPDLIALQEIENDRVLSDLIARPELTTPYLYLYRNGPDLRGIDNAVLYRPDRVTLLSIEPGQGCTALQDGLGPDGSGDPAHPANGLTCDRDGDGNLDGNRLFSRPPLVVHFQLMEYAQPGEIWLLANHWKSKSEDTGTAAYTLPRRIEQARFVAEITAGILALDPQANIVVVGDLNDTLASAPLAELNAAGMTNLWYRLPPEQRYSYIYQGYSQPLDHILVHGPWVSQPPDGMLWAARINADYPYRYTSLVNTPSGCSDHDPLLVQFNFLPAQSFLPLAISDLSHPSRAALP